MRDPRHQRRLWFWLFTAICVIAAAGYVVWRVSQSEQAPSPAQAEIVDPTTLATIAALQASPHLYFASTRAGHFMNASVASIAEPDRGLITGVNCERIHFGREHGLCLSENRSQLTPVTVAQIIDRRFHAVHTISLGGLPIRARVSADDRYAVATVFVTGENYVSDFTTRTTLIDIASGRSLGDLEQFVTERDGQVFREVDFNFWGVTFFDDSNRFFATLGTGGRRFLVEGDIARRRLRVVRDDVECPSLSPDQKRLVFKSRTRGTPAWRLHALDLATMAEWPVSAANLSVDDQAEWLDNEHVLYGVHDDIGLPEQALNIWISPVSKPGAAPESRIFLRSASSPAVGR